MPHSSLQWEYTPNSHKKKHFFFFFQKRWITGEQVLQNRDLLPKYKPPDMIYEEWTTGKYCLNVYGFI